MVEPAPPAAAQAVTVVQPAAPALAPLLIDIGAWAGAMVAIAALVALLHKLITRDLARDVKELQHKAGNTTTRLNALEHLRTGDVERIVKIEAAVSSFDKAVERVERGQEKLAETINHQFDTLAASIREIRTVAPRS